MKDEILLKTYLIGDIEYSVINEVDYNGIHYLFLLNSQDETDIMIRKVVDDCLEVLDNEQEVMEVMKLIIK